MRNYITLQEASQLLPTRPAVCTVWRWCVNGIRVRKAAQTVKLRSVCIGRKMFTTADWLEEFIHRLTAARLGTFQPVIDHKPPPHAHQPMSPAEIDEILRRARI